MASARRSPRRSPASTPTSTGSVFCACGSATSERNQSTKGGFRSGSAPRDLTHLARIGLEHPEVRYEIVYGVSNNRRSWYDNSNAYRLGYRPQDDSEPFSAAVLAAEPPDADPIAERYQGGTFCAAEFTATALPDQAMPEGEHRSGGKASRAHHPPPSPSGEGRGDWAPQQTVQRWPRLPTCAENDGRILREGSAMNPSQASA
jgi:hypothetical protein